MLRHPIAGSKARTEISQLSRKEFQRGLGIACTEEGPLTGRYKLCHVDLSLRPRVSSYRPVRRTHQAGGHGRIARSYELHR